MEAIELGSFQLWGWSHRQQFDVAERNQSRVLLRWGVWECHWVQWRPSLLSVSLAQRSGVPENLMATNKTLSCGILSYEFKEWNSQIIYCEWRHLDTLVGPNELTRFYLPIIFICLWSLLQNPREPKRGGQCSYLKGCPGTGYPWAVSLGLLKGLWRRGVKRPCLQMLTELQYWGGIEILRVQMLVTLSRAPCSLLRWN